MFLWSNHAHSTVANVISNPFVSAGTTSWRITGQPIGRQRLGSCPKLACQTAPAVFFWANLPSDEKWGEELKVMGGTTCVTQCVLGLSQSITSALSIHANTENTSAAPPWHYECIIPASHANSRMNWAMRLNWCFGGFRPTLTQRLYITLYFGVLSCLVKWVRHYDNTTRQAGRQISRADRGSGRLGLWPLPVPQNTKSFKNFILKNVTTYIYITYYIVIKNY